MKRVYVVALLALFCSVCGSAQSRSYGTKARQSTCQQGVSSYQQQVNALLEAFHFDGFMRFNIDESLQEMKGKVTNYKRMLAEVAAAVTPELRKDAVAKISSSFSETELRKLNKTLNTVVGQATICGLLNEGGWMISYKTPTNADYQVYERTAGDDFLEQFEKAMAIVSDAVESVSSPEMEQKIKPVVSKYMRK